MSNPFKTAKFRKLKAVWERKLAKAGHVEIEDQRHDEPMLLRWDAHYFIQRNGLKSEAQARYYELARHFLEMHYFDTTKEKLIWECHADGLSMVDTAAKLKCKHWDVRKAMKKLMKAFKP